MSGKIETGSMGQICWKPEGTSWILRHVRDRDVAAEKLKKLKGWSDLEEMVRHDAQGQYRPLRSAPDLVTGWLYEAKDESDFWEALEVIYPGLWGNAQAWQEGNLRVESWEAALAKQTTRMQKKARESADLPNRVIQSQCKMRCLKIVVWGGEEAEKKGDPHPMICTGPCGMFWGALGG